jgi:hypothetical protein
MPDPQPKPGDGFRAAWRKALADLHRAQRNKRGKRPPPPITGIVIPRQSGKAATAHAAARHPPAPAPQAPTQDSQPAAPDTSHTDINPEDRSA